MRKGIAFSLQYRFSKKERRKKERKKKERKKERKEERKKERKEERKRKTIDNEELDCPRRLDNWNMLYLY